MNTTFHFAGCAVQSYFSVDTLALELYNEQTCTYTQCTYARLPETSLWSVVRLKPTALSLPLKPQPTWEWNTNRSLGIISSSLCLCLFCLRSKSASWCALLFKAAHETREIHTPIWIIYMPSFQFIHNVGRQKVSRCLRSYSIHIQTHAIQTLANKDSTSFRTLICYTHTHTASQLSLSQYWTLFASSHSGTNTTTIFC